VITALQARLHAADLIDWRVSVDSTLYAQRQAVERGTSRLNRHCALASCHDKLAVRYQATAHIAAIDERLYHLRSVLITGLGRQIP